MYQKREETLEMLKLYQEEGMTCRQIGELYGISGVAVWSRFDRMGIAGKYRKIHPSMIDKTRLVNLYQIERLAIKKIAAVFDAPEGIIKDALRLHRIPERPLLRLDGKHADRLRKLHVGDSIEIESLIKNPHFVLRGAARIVGIKISVRILGGGRLTVTRVNETVRGRQPKHTEIDRARLAALYLKKRLSIVQIGETLGYADPVIRNALKFYSIPKRAPLQIGGKYIAKLRRLNIEENIEINSFVKYPLTNLHTIAKRAGVKISVRNLGDGRFKVSRTG